MTIKNILFCACLGVMGLLAPPAFADGTWYIGADLGRAGYSGLQDIGGPFGGYYHTVDIPFAGSNTDHDTAYRVSGGFQFNPYVALEVGYVDLGKVEIKGVVTFPPTTLAQAVDDKLKVHGFLTDAVGRWPFAAGWALYGRAGVFLSHVDYEQGASGSSTTANDGKFTFGAGVAWTAADHIGLKLGWDRFADLGGMTSTGQFSVNLLSLGVVYSF